MNLRQFKRSMRGTPLRSSRAGGQQDGPRLCVGPSPDSGRDEAGAGASLFSVFCPLSVAPDLVRGPGSPRLRFARWVALMRAVCGSRALRSRHLSIDVTNNAYRKAVGYKEGKQKRGRRRRLPPTQPVGQTGPCKPVGFIAQNEPQASPFASGGLGDLRCETPTCSRSSQKETHRKALGYKEVRATSQSVRRFVLPTPAPPRCHSDRLSEYPADFPDEYASHSILRSLSAAS